ncbi:hypothetical protein O3G_MSEX006337 [Manduca sexta]|uniref:Uncharacterized protein n=1 Tax=Manduca sexta TaxID=7130 RepID=A0A922CL86_MANSE|nr:hypothetical protein O3G_MSEX006337 [Manduca sexta]
MHKRMYIKFGKHTSLTSAITVHKILLLNMWNNVLGVWVPQFKTEDGKDSKVKFYNYTYGLPDCEATQWRSILDFGKSEDELNLLTDGRLRHLIHHEHSTDSMKEEPQPSNPFSLHENIPIPEVKEPASYIHVQNKYCMDKILITNTSMVGIYAQVCIPEVKANWKDFNFLMKKVLNPIFHAIAMVLFLIVAIIYFVLPTLRDLPGNIITTINVCLIVSQAADLVRIFTEFSNHISFMITDIILYISLLAAFFWLNSFGFYIWKTFKSRNVFLRVTDVRKYCYYSCVVWCCVTVMAAMAICAHFLLDMGTNPYRKTRRQFSSSVFVDDAEQETIGKTIVYLYLIINNTYRLKKRNNFYVQDYLALRYFSHQLHLP